MAEYPRPTWEEFTKRFQRRWAQGEHVFINGQTGSGKTDLLLKLMDMRRAGVVLVTKPRDPIFKTPEAKQYARKTVWAPRMGERKIMLASQHGDSARSQIGNQVDIFGHALDRIYADGGWTVGVDETLWITQHLKLRKEVEALAFMGRALGLTGIFATQRPAHIPVIVPQSASHAFIAKTGRASDLATLAELGGDPRELKAALMTLRDQHDFVYVDTQSRLPIMIVNTHR